MIQIKLSQLEIACKQTEKVATPHRTPRFEVIRRLADEEDPEVHMAMTFLEEKNTGYDGLLERYLCNAGAARVGFEIELLPGLLKEKPVATKKKIR